MDIDLNEASLDSLMRKYLRYKFMGDVGEAALKGIAPDSAEDKLRKKAELLDIALKQKALGMDYSDEDEENSLIPKGLERQVLIAALGSASRLKPASVQTQRQAMALFGKLPPSNLSKLGFTPVFKEAVLHEYPHAIDSLSLFRRR